MKRVSFVIIIAAGLIASGRLSSGQSQPTSKCLRYEPEVVTFAGTLVRKTFPGPPNYENVNKGDRAETYWLLDLMTSACVDEDKAEPDLNPAQTGVREIQLVLQPQQYAQYKAPVGKKIVATGTLFGEHTGHHHTSVLLKVRTLKETSR